MKTESQTPVLDSFREHRQSMLAAGQCASCPANAACETITSEVRAKAFRANPQLYLLTMQLGLLHVVDSVGEEIEAEQHATM